MAINIVMFRGDTFTIEFSVQDETGVKFDLTNWDVRFKAGTILKTTEDLNEGEITSPKTDGKGKIFLKPLDTNEEPDPRPDYDLEIFDSTNVHTFLTGTLQIKIKD